MCNLLTSALVVSLTLVLASCGTPTRRTGAGGELGEGGCPAGEERTCDCEGGDAGVEVCLEDGSAWGECGCGAAEGEGEGPAEGEGEGEGAAEGEGEGPAEGEGEGPGEGEGEGPAEGEGEGPGEGEGEGPAEGEGEGEGEVPPGPPDPDDVDLEWGWGFVMDSMVIDAQAGFDLDGDGQRNNALSLVGLLANDQLAASLADGQLTLLFDLRAEDPVDNPEFPLHFYMGQDQDGDASDNFSGEEEFVVELTSFDGAGDSLVHFNDTVIEDRRVSAATNRFPLSLPAGDGVIEVTLYYTQLEADVQGEFGALVQGNLGGAVREDELRAALAQMPIDPSLVGMIDMFLSNPDIDTDGDGRADGFSIGMFFSAVSCSFADFLGE